MEHNMNNEQKYSVCIYCGYALMHDGEIVFCDKCKTIAFRKGFDNETIKAEILNYIKRVQMKLLDRKDLHIIEQKRLDRKELSSQEKELYNFCLEFRNTYTDIKLLLKGNYDRIGFRKTLYRLLQLTKREKGLLD